MQEDPLPIAAIVCTLDRGSAILSTLAALLEQDLDPNLYEILIVDNGSREENAALLREQVRDEAPRLRYLREDRIGESSARNRALRECSAGILAFIDDDAIADPGWLRSIRDAFASHLNLGAVGGRVLLELEADRPAWLDAELLPYLSGFDLGESQRQLSFPDYPRGANMAFRSELFADGAVFDERLGLQGSCLLTMSETEICYRTSRAGWEVAYLHGACVRHMIGAGRLRRDWFSRRVHWQGRSRCTFEALHFGRLHLLRRIPGQVWAFLRKRGLQRQLHLGYLAACLPTLCRSLTPIQPVRARE